MWVNRDPIQERSGVNIYVFCANSTPSIYDIQGMIQESVNYNGLTYTYNPADIHGSVEADVGPGAGGGPNVEVVASVDSTAALNFNRSSLGRNAAAYVRVEGGATDNTMSLLGEGDTDFAAYERGGGKKHLLQMSIVLARSSTVTGCCTSGKLIANELITLVIPSGQSGADIDATIKYPSPVATTRVTQNTVSAGGGGISDSKVIDFSSGNATFTMSVGMSWLSAGYKFALASASLDVACKP